MVLRLRHSDLVENPEAALRSVFSFLDESYAPECLTPLAQRINSSNVPAGFKIDLRKTDPSLIEQATRLSQQVEESSQPPEASPAAVEEIEAAFDERVQFVATLVRRIPQSIAKNCSAEGEKSKTHGPGGETCETDQRKKGNYSRSAHCRAALQMASFIIQGVARNVSTGTPGR